MALGLAVLIAVPIGQAAVKSAPGAAAFASAVLSPTSPDLASQTAAGGTWTEVGSGGLARARAAMAYDPGMDRLVLFGGSSAAGFLGDTWTYTFVGDVWTPRRPDIAPPARAESGMVYDVRQDRAVLFGGASDAGVLGDTWGYDLSTNTWTNLAPTVAPPARSEASMAYDSRADRVLLFGGYTAAGPLNDTWSYDLANNTWTELAPTTAPSPRYEHVMAYDGAADRTVLFGGVAGSALPETWSFDFTTNTWTNESTTFQPWAQTGFAMAYDPAQDRIVLTGGATSEGSLIRWDAWSYDVDANAWTAAAATAVPPARSEHMLAFDATLGRLIVFGGASATGFLGDTWVYDPGTNAWYDRAVGTPAAAGGYGFYDAYADRFVVLSTSPAAVWSYDVASDLWLPSPATSGPSARIGVALDYDARAGRVLLFGGYDYSFYRNDTWSYDFTNNTWTELFPASAPSPRYEQTMVYDAAADRMVLFGGAWGSGATYTAVAETWTYDPDANAWTNVTSDPAPSPRQVPTMAYDAHADRTVLFGGLTLSGIPMGDTWTYDLGSRTWANVTPAVSPSARYGNAIAYDAGAQTVVLYGGAMNAFVDVPAETWTFDAATHTWTNVTAPASPPVWWSPVMAYDPTADRMVVLLNGRVSYRPYVHTWLYELEANRWTDNRVSREPTGRERTAMAYDARADRTILFGGTGETGLFGDTWSYDAANDTWTEMQPTVSPDPRESSALVYDPVRDRFILFGGYATTGLANDTWSYDLNTDVWTELHPAVAPSPRYRAAMAYDSHADRVLLFGSASDDDTWAFDPVTGAWTPLNPAPHPPALDSPRLIYDTRGDRSILCGDTRTAETWAFDFETNAWLQLAPGPHAIGQQAMAYDSPADRTVLFGGIYVPPGGRGPVAVRETWSYDLNADAWRNLTSTAGPSAREGPTMVYDTRADRFLLFGGYDAWVGYRSDTWSYAYPPALPAAPQQLVAGAGNGEVTLTWQPPVGAEGGGVATYKVYRGTASGAEGLVASPGDVLTYTDAGLTNGVTYFYRVSAVNAAGEGGQSTEVSATPLSLPSAPDTVVATGGNAEVNLSWAAPATDGGSVVLHYRVYRGTAANTLAFVAELGNVLAYTDAGLTNGVAYFYQVSAVTAVGEGPRSSLRSAMPATVPGAPTGLAAHAKEGQVTLTWTAPADDGGYPIRNYRVYRGAASGAETFLVATGTLPTFTDVGLTDGVAYFYQVSAATVAGEGGRSAEASATPAPPADTVAPAIAFASPAEGTTLTSTTVHMVGIASDNVGVAKVELSLDGTTWSLAAGTTSWAATLTLAEGANTITARATDASGNTNTASVHVIVQLSTGPADAGAATPPWLWILAVVGVVAVVAVALLVWRWRRKALPDSLLPEA